MIKVIIPGSVAYRDEPCHESAFGSIEVFNSDLYDWLDDHATSSGWDHDYHSNNVDCVVEISDPKVAMLFKLTWGGK